MEFKSAFGHFRANALVSYNNQVYRIKRVLTDCKVIALNLLTGKPETLDIERLQAVDDRLVDGSTVPRPDLAEVRGEDWEEAQRMFEVIKPLIQPGDVRKTYEEVIESSGLSRSTLQRAVRKFVKSGGILSSLLPSAPGPKAGSRRLTPQMEEVITESIKIYLTKQRLTAADVVRDVRRRCHNLGLKKYPSSKAVRARLKALDTARTLRARGYDDVVRDRFTPDRGSTPVPLGPMQVIQIDHTKLDIVCVAGRQRIPIGRPYMTLAIDVYSRMVVGFLLSFDEPGAMAVSLCLGHAMLPKDKYLERLGVDAPWRVWGRPRMIFTDNGKDLKAGNLGMFCQEYDIDWQYRQAGDPHYGGIVESGVRNLIRQTHKIPGTTFSNPKERKGVDSEALACMTKRELEVVLMTYILTVYHKDKHSSLYSSPEAQWKIGTDGDGHTDGIGEPDLPMDPEKIYYDSLPVDERTIQEKGIQWGNIFYNHPVLNRYLHAKDPKNDRYPREFIVRRDPRDISRVIFRDPETKIYHPIPYRNTGHPSISLWEKRAVEEYLTKEGKAKIDEAAIFRGYEEIMRLTQESVAKTKAARKNSLKFKEKSVEALTDLHPIPGEPAAGTRQAFEEVLRQPPGEPKPKAPSREAQVYTHIEVSHD